MPTIKRKLGAFFFRRLKSREDIGRKTPCQLSESDNFCPTFVGLLARFGVVGCSLAYRISESHAVTIFA